MSHILTRPILFPVSNGSYVQVINLAAYMLTNTDMWTIFNKYDDRIIEKR